MAELSAWNVAAASNNAAPPDGWPENMAYSNVNNSARENMAVLARFYKDTNGSLSLGGVANAYTLTLNAAHTSYFAGMWFVAKVVAANTAASTINVNSLGVKNLVNRLGGALIAGELVAGGLYAFYYDGTSFQVSNSPSGVAVSHTSVDVTGSTPPPNGIYLPAANTVGIASNSIGRVFVDANGLGVGATISLGNSAKAGTDRMLEVQSTTNNDIVSIQAFVNDGVNNRRAALWVDDTAGTFGITGTASSGVPEFRLEVGGLTPITVGNAGNVTIAAPSSSNTLTVNNIAGNYAVYMPNGTVAAGLVNSGSSLQVYVGSAHSLEFVTNGAVRQSINSAGNVTVNAPSSGTTLTVNVITGQPALVVGKVSFGDDYSLGTGANVRSGTDVMNIGTSGAASTILFSNGQQRVTIATAGNVTVNAPSGGNTLTVNGLTGAATASLVSTGAAGALNLGWSIGLFSSFWNIYSAGTDPIVIGTVGNAEYRIATNSLTRYQISGAGNHTISAPSSGASLAVTSIATGTAQTWTDGTVSASMAFSSSIATIGATTNHATRLISNNTERLRAEAAGNIIVYAPASGIATTINSLSNGVALSLTDGATEARFQFDTDIFILGTVGADSVYLRTNNTNRLQLSSGGNLTINAPSSGTALAITGVAGGAGLIVTGSASTPPFAVTFSATAMTVDCTRSNVFTTTFTANVTTAPTISNPQDGQTINWFITQDATGSRTMTWPTSFKWPSGTAGVLSTTANAVDLLVATYRSDTAFWYASLQKGFA